MSTRWYPLYKKGNPQLRIFLPNFWMKLIRPEEPLPSNMVLFQTSIQMTEHDVKNYLEKIYKVQVVDVKTFIKMGNIRSNGKSLVKDDDYKHSLVTLPKDWNFEFPDIAKQVRSKDKERIKELNEAAKASQKNNQHRLGIPAWFSSL